MGAAKTKEKEPLLFQTSEASIFAPVLLVKTYNPEEMDSAIKDVTNYTNNTGKIVVIKSTVVPGTTDKYCKEYPRTTWKANS